MFCVLWKTTKIDRIISQQNVDSEIISTFFWTQHRNMNMLRLIKIIAIIKTCQGVKNVGGRYDRTKKAMHDIKNAIVSASMSI